MTWVTKFVHFRNIYGLGTGQLNFVKNMINLTGALNILNFIKLYFPEIAGVSLLLVPIGVVSYIVIGLVMGLYLDSRLEFIHKERSWTNKRDPQINEILLRLKRIEQKL